MESPLKMSAIKKFLAYFVYVLTVSYANQKFGFIITQILIKALLSKKIIISIFFFIIYT